MSESEIVGKNGSTVRVYAQPLRTLVLGLIYTFVLCTALGMSWLLRFDFEIPPRYFEAIVTSYVPVVTLQLLALFGFRQFSGILRYFSLPDILQVGWAIAASNGLLLFGRFLGYTEVFPSRGVLLLDSVLAFGGICAVRLFWRVYHRRFTERGVRSIGERAVIVGAGDVGANLIGELKSRRQLGVRPVVFLDEDERKWGGYLHGVPVTGGIDRLKEFTRRYRLQTLIIAMPSAPAKKIGDVAALARQCGLRCVTVPSIDQLATGRVSVSQLHAVSIEDLLGREAVALETENIRKIIADKVVMVTGAGGSIGSEICRQVSGYSPRQLLLVDHSEVQLFPIEQELIRDGFGEGLLPLVASIYDDQRMRSIFRDHKPEVILHAAAHKHVPLMEAQPSEALKNNTLGTARLAGLAATHGVERFLMISTDKAVNPTNAMGASKRLAELYIQALSRSIEHRTKFAAVRFGNVLGSSGSVVPTFTRQIANGGPVTVTHPDMVRYFMTIPEAVGLVLQSCAQGKGGEIFVLDMGQPVKIADLARQMIELSGLKPDIDIEVKYVGLRPGEKLFEELNCHGEAFQGTHHPKIMSFIGEPQSLHVLKESFKELEELLYEATPEELKRRMSELIPEYTPFGSCRVPDDAPEFSPATDTGARQKHEDVALPRTISVDRPRPITSM